MRQLEISTDPNDIQIILGLVDYNPASTLFDSDSIKALPFANQIKIFRSGFGMWQDSMESISQQ